MSQDIVGIKRKELDRLVAEKRELQQESKVLTQFTIILFFIMVCVLFAAENLTIYLNIAESKQLIGVVGVLISVLVVQLLVNFKLKPNIDKHKILNKKLKKFEELNYGKNLYNEMIKVD
jgi:hypothetical protein